MHRNNYTEVTTEKQLHRNNYTEITMRKLFYAPLARENPGHL